MAPRSLPCLFLAYQKGCAAWDKASARSSRLALQTPLQALGSDPADLQTWWGSPSSSSS